MLGVLPVLLLASIVVVYRQQEADRIYTGVSVFGIDLSRLTRDEAAAVIKRTLLERSRQSFLLRYDDDAISVTLATMGLVIDDGEIATLVDRAWQVGRGEPVGPWLRTQLQLFRHGYALPAALHVDPQRAAAVLGRVAPDIEHPTENASFSVEKAGERFEIHTTPARTGRRLNVAATIDRLQRSLVNDIPTSLDLVLDVAPPAITDADLQPAIRAVQVILGSPLVFRDGTRTWSLDPPAAYDMLQISGLDAGHPPITAQLDDAKLRAFVEKVARAADQPARNPSFAVQGDRVVIQPGAPGRLADADATFELAKQRAADPASHTVDIVFVDDQPWLTEADLQPVATQANTRLDLPITIQTPAAPGILDHKWVLDRPQLAQLLAFPNTQAVPRDYATLPPERRPSLEIQLDPTKVAGWIDREVGPWVSEEPVDAELQLKKTEVEVPNPAYTAPRSAAPVQATATPAAGATPPPGATPAAGATPTAQSGTSQPAIPPTIRETRYTVELRNARDGRGPDTGATFAELQLLFRSGMPAEPDARVVTVRLAPRPPKVHDQDLAAARDTANKLIGEPITVRWRSTTWVVTRDELAGMLRYQTGRDGVMAYLTRDGLLAKASAIAEEARRLPDAPRDSNGQPLPVDVPATASAIWMQASTVPANRVAEVVWQEETPPAPESGGAP